MESSNMKNMVVLKNLPSNIIEEAIVILKENKKMKNYQYIEEKNKKENIEEKSRNKNVDAKPIQGRSINQKQKKLTQEANNVKEDYILKEAEMVISNYISELEKKSSKWKNNMQKLEIKYKNSVKLNFILAFTAIVSIILSLA